jgi:flavin reductase (DIM6/NTAB) family NADH-FMN oxidoreductase RutF
LTTGAPALKRAPAAFDCVVENTFAYAGSTIVVGRVVDLSVTQGDTMVYVRGCFNAGIKS